MMTSVAAWQPKVSSLAESNVYSSVPCLRRTRFSVGIVNWSPEKWDDSDRKENSGDPNSPGDL
jgi:hypothetical protein